MKLRFYKGVLNVSSIILNYGVVPDLVRKKTEHLVSKVLQQKDDFNYASYDLTETPIHQVIEDALTVPFLSEQKVIVVKESLMFTGDKTKGQVEHNIDELLEFITNFDGPNIVIFEVYREKLDERKKLVKQLKSLHTVNQIGVMDEKALVQWIKTTLNNQFKDIKQDALTELIHLTGIDYKTIKNEIEKLLLYVGDAPVITKQDVSLIVSRSLEQNVFLLTDYIVANKKKEALSLIKDLIQMKEEPIKLLALISGQYRLFYQTKIMAQKGYSEAQMAKQLKVHPYRIKLAMQKVRKYELSTLLNIIDQCATADYELKSSYLDKVLILELFILNLKV